MSSLKARIEALERQLMAPPPMPEGSVELHYLGGWRQVRGERCDEHDGCAFTTAAISGPLRLLYLVQWQPGLPEAPALG